MRLRRDIQRAAAGRRGTRIERRRVRHVCAAAARPRGLRERGLPGDERLLAAGGLRLDDNHVGRVRGRAGPHAQAHGAAGGGRQIVLGACAVQHDAAARGRDGLARGERHAQAADGQARAIVNKISREGAWRRGRRAVVVDIRARDGDAQRVVAVAAVVPRHEAEHCIAAVERARPAVRPPRGVRGRPVPDRVRARQEGGPVEVEAHDGGCGRGRGRGGARGGGRENDAGHKDARKLTSLGHSVTSRRRVSTADSRGQSDGLGCSAPVSPTKVLDSETDGGLDRLEEGYLQGDYLAVHWRQREVS